MKSDLGKVIINSFCKKCKRKVCNGILCDYCDRWLHFKCGKINENDLQNDFNDWKCPLCVEVQDDLVASSETNVNELSSFNEIILVLRKDLDDLKAQNTDLKKSLSWVEGNLKQELLNNDTGRLSLNTKHYPSGWVTVTRKGKPSLKSLSDFPPLEDKNRFSILGDLVEVEVNTGPTNKTDSTEIIEKEVLAKKQEQKCDP